MKKLETEVKELSEFLKEFNKESDRGGVLIAASYLDEILGEILKVFMVETKEAQEMIFGFNAPIGAFSARIKAAYSFALIEENEFKELNIIRKIRNEFGHSWKQVTFEDQKINSLCNNLPWLGPKEMEEESNSKARFNFSVAILLTDLMWRKRLVKNERREIKVWPNKARSL